MYLRAINCDQTNKTVTPDIAFGEGEFDISALENYILTNKEDLSHSDKPITIDLSKFPKPVVTTQAKAVTK